MRQVLTFVDKIDVEIGIGEVLHGQLGGGAHQRSRDQRCCNTFSKDSVTFVTVSLPGGLDLRRRLGDEEAFAAKRIGKLAMMRMRTKGLRMRMRVSKCVCLYALASECMLAFAGACACMCAWTQQKCSHHMLEIR